MKNHGGYMIYYRTKNNDWEPVHKYGTCKYHNTMTKKFQRENLAPENFKIVRITIREMPL